MKADLIIYNIKTLYTPYLNPPLRGKSLNKIKQIDNAYIAIKDEKIIAVDNNNYEAFLDSSTKLFNAKGKICLPGFVDAHTHLVHASSREDEFLLLKQGATYLEILAAGGGILNTVRKTRAASFNSLYQQAKASLKQMLSYGITTLEAKSGYGLDLENEVKQLLVAQKLNEKEPVCIVSTYMGAHAIPLAFKNNKDQYVNAIIKDLKEIKALGFVDAVDVFCEDQVFSLKDTEKILTKAKQLGFKIRLHADEITALGGTALGVKLKANSVDHLIEAKESDLISLGQSKTYACILPATSFFLQKPYAKARFMVDNNVSVCIASDYNPGSCPSENFLFVMHLAANYLKLTPEEILSATTLNPAHLLEKDKTKGSLQIGKDADIILLDAPNLAYVLYHFGINHVNDVFIKGKQVVKNKKVVRIK